MKKHTNLSLGQPPMKVVVFEKQAKNWLKMGVDVI